MELKITAQNRRLIEDLEADPEHPLFVWDSDLKGYGVRITPSGVLSFIARFRVGGGRAGKQRVMTLGRVGVMTYKEARAEARDVLAAASLGRDPLEERDTDRGSKSPTLSEFADRYLDEYVDLNKKPTSAAEDRRIVEAYIKPELGTKRLTKLDAKDIRKLIASMAKTPYMANRVWAVLSRMLNKAEGWGLRPDGSNPCPQVDRYPEKSRQRFLSAEELARLGVALSDAVDHKDPEKRVSPTVALAIRLLVLTGCRLREILHLRWSEVDIRNGALRLSDSKTGRKTIPLGPPALELLTNAPRIESNPYVLPGHLKECPLTTLRPGWGRITKAAELGDLRPHDLRHAWASVAAISGESLVVIGAVLGHRDADTTRKYAHLSIDPIRATATRTAETIAEQMSAKATGGEVVPFEGRK